jgi:hypothetical protein
MGWGQIDATKGQQRARAYGSTFKNAATKFGLYLEPGKATGEAWLTVRGNNVDGLPRTLAVLNRETWRWQLLTITTTSEEELRDELLAAITAKPGIASRELRTTVPGRDDRIRDALLELVDEQRIAIVKDGNAKRHYPYGTEPAAGQEAFEA